MPGTAAKKKRTARFNVRLSEREARLIRLGAERLGINVTNFILDSACVRAAQEIAEARHFELYVGLARERYAGEWESRLNALAQAEAQLATAPDGELRFHSGPPAKQSG